MKTIEQLKPNYAPVYAAALYPELCKVFNRHGYALSVHGSLARDFDLVAIPWADSVSEPEAVLVEVVKTFALSVVEIPTRFTIKNHGRIAYTLSIGFGECAIDLSFIPFK